MNREEKIFSGRSILPFSFADALRDVCEHERVEAYTFLLGASDQLGMKRFRDSLDEFAGHCARRGGGVRPTPVFLGLHPALECSLCVDEHERDLEFLNFSRTTPSGLENGRM